MVAIVAGKGLGLFNASLNTLGGSGLRGQGLALGQGGGNAYVNVATGNLVMQVLDDSLSGAGLDLRHLRTYNSAGAATDGDADNWRWDGEAKIAFFGTPPQSGVYQAGSYLERTTGDGYVARFELNANRTAFVSKDGSGAHDTLVLSGSDWIYEEGSSGLKEFYSDATKRLRERRDRSGNAITFAYDAAGRLENIEDAQSKQRFKLTYSTVPNTALVRLSQVDTYSLVAATSSKHDSNGVPLQNNVTQSSALSAATMQVRYGYDNLGRLTSVTTDLSPDNNVSDGNVYVTAYAYELDSLRIKTVTQSDGTSVSFTYYDASQNYRLKTVTDAFGTQTFNYNSGYTRVTDVNNKNWDYYYDANGQMTKVVAPGGVTHQFSYDADGNVATVTDGRGNIVTYLYDTNGNRRLERDALGNTITRTFDAFNQITTETRYRVADPDGSGSLLPSESETTRYVYDTKQRLRFIVSAQGRVSENVYDTSKGYLLETRQYSANKYDVSALTETSVLTEANVIAWKAGINDKSKQQLSVLSYDYRGNLQSKTDYAEINADGSGKLTDAAIVNRYVYDEYGQLLQTIVTRGAARATDTTLVSTIYDGMGRVQTQTNASGTNTYVYDGANKQIVVTNSAGLTTTQTFDSVGRLTMVSQTASGESTRTTTYTYDTVGRLRMVNHGGNRSFSFYDDSGRVTYRVDSSGAVIGYEYNNNDQISKETRYKNVISTAARAAWESAGVVTKTTLTKGSNGTDIIVDATYDRVVQYDYDNAGRLLTQTDAAGHVTSTIYDGTGRIAQLQKGDRVTKYFYDADGKQIGLLDSLGYLTENRYDEAGRLIETIKYFARTNTVSNAVPVWPAIPNQSTIAGYQYSINLPRAYDADGDTLTFELASTLPSWLKFDAHSLRLYGTPTAVGTHYVTVKATDSRGASSNVVVTVNVTNAIPQWSDLGSTTIKVNAAFSLQLPQASDADGHSLAYSVVSGMPDGLSFNAAELEITGTPTTPGNYSIVFRAADAYGGSVQKALSITVANDAPNWASTTFGDLSFAVNGAINNAFPVANDPEGQTITYTATGLPSGLSLITANGIPVLSGTPATPGSYAVTIRASDQHGQFSSRSFTLTITNAPPAWDNLTAQTIAVNSSLSYVLPAAIDPESQGITYSVSGLPTGLAFDAASRSFTGKPQVAGNFTVTAKATDQHGAQTTRTFLLTVTNTAPTWTAFVSSVPSVAVTASHSYIAAAAIDPEGQSLSYSVVGSLPAGLSFDAATRKVSGTPTTPGSYTITLRATDAAGAFVDKAYTLNVTNAAPTWTTLANRSIAVNTSFTHTIAAATDAEAQAITYSVVSGLPAGVSFDAATRTFSGKVQNAGTYTVTVRAQDPHGAYIDRTLVITGTNTGPSWPAISTQTTAVNNASFSFTAPAATDPEGEALTYAVTTALPPGVSFNASTRTFSGRPTTPGTYSITLRATDPQSAVSYASFSITVTNAAPTFASVSNQTVNLNQAINYTVPAATDAEGQAVTYVAKKVVWIHHPEVIKNGEVLSEAWDEEVISDLPTWLTFNPTTRVLSGSSAAPESFNVRITATDPHGAAGQTEFAVSVVNGAPTWPAISATAASVNTGYSFTVPAASDPDGQALTYSVVSGLPAGLSFNTSTRVISGTPTTPGSYTVVLKATDPYGANSNVSFTLNVNNAAPTWPSISPSMATMNQGYGFTVPAATDPEGQGITYAYVSGLPAGLTFNTSTRAISGTPTAAGAFSVTLRATDIHGASTNVSFTLSVNSAPTWSAIALQNGSVNSSFSFAVPAASDAQGHSISYALISSLPSGLSFNSSTRVISGTPTRGGNYSVTVRATDSLGAVADTTFTISIANSTPVYNGGLATQTVFAGQAINYQFGSSLFTDPNGESLTYYATAIERTFDDVSKKWLEEEIGLPVGLNFNASTRTFSGNVSAIASHLIEVRAYDNSGASGTGRFTLDVKLNAAPNWPILADQTVAYNTAYSYTLPAATDAEGHAISYSIVSSLPPGLSFNPSTRVISGTPTTIGNYTLTAMATDAFGAATYRSYTLNVTSGNMPPVYNGLLQDLVVGGYQTVAYTFPSNTFTDSNGDTLTYTVTGKPTWLSFNAATRTFSGKAPKMGYASITVTASDGKGGSASGTFNIEIGAFNEGTMSLRSTSKTTLTTSTSKSARFAKSAAAPTMMSAMTVSNSDPLADYRIVDNARDQHQYFFYDAMGRLVGNVDERNTLTEFVFNEAANRQQTIRYAGAVNYTAGDTLDAIKTRVASSTKQISTTQFDDFNRVLTQTNFEQTETVFEYDAAGRLVKTTAARAQQEVANSNNAERIYRQRYNAFGEVTGSLSAEGERLSTIDALTFDNAIDQYGTSNKYDALGRLIETKDANGNKTWFYYDEQNRLVYTVNALGEVHENVYNAFSQVEKSITHFVKQNTVQMAKTGKHTDLTVTAHANDLSFSNRFDTRGLVFSTTDINGNVVSLEYNAFGERIKQTQHASAGDIVTLFRYNKRGEHTDTVRDYGGLNATESVAYDAFGRVRISLDASGNIKKTDFDDAGRSITITDYSPTLTGKQSKTTFDAFGRVYRVWNDARVATEFTEYSYDDVNLSVTVKTPENISVTTYKSRHGQTLRLVDGNGVGTDYHYNRDGQLLTVTVGGTLTTENAYVKGRLITSKDGNGTLTQLKYDALNRVIDRIIDPTEFNANGLNLHTHYDFNEFGEQIRVTEGYGTTDARVTEYAFDHVNRRQTITVDPSGLKLTTTMVYDELGNTVEMWRGDVANLKRQASKYYYDKLNRRIKEVDASSDILSSGALDITTQYKYDIASRLSRKIDANGNSTWYAYDTLGRLVYTINAMGGVSKLEYDAQDRVVKTRQLSTALTATQLSNLYDVNSADSVSELVSPNDSTDHISTTVYDGNGRVKYTVNALGYVTAFNYDGNGNVIARTEYDRAIDIGEAISEQLINSGIARVGIGDDTRITRFAYDQRNRLRFEVNALGYVKESRYDAAGNRIAIIQYVRKPALNNNFSYDNIGQKLNAQLSDGENRQTNFVYDSANRLRFTRDALGYLSESIYDNVGRLRESRQFDINASNSVLTISALERLTSNPIYEEPIEKPPVVLDYERMYVGDGTTRGEHRVYDKAGRTRFVINAQNHVKELIYDAVGNVLREIFYPEAISGSSNRTETSVRTELDRISKPNGTQYDDRIRVFQYVYDKANRRRFSVNSLGEITETKYDALGRVDEQLYYDQAMSPIPIPSHAPRSLHDMGNWVINRALFDQYKTRGEKYTYDGVGRLKTVTDGDGYTEVHGYDAFGNRSVFKDKRDHVWNYTYDKLNRKLDEISPLVDVWTTNGTESISRKLVSTTAYDAFGNIVAVSEGRLLDNATLQFDDTNTRTTEYKYDKLDRQYRTTQSGYYDNADGAFHKGTPTKSTHFTVYSEVSFNAFGDAVLCKTVIGYDRYAYQYKAYDSLGRLRFEVDALDYLTEYRYNAFGDQTTIRRVNNKVNILRGVPATFDTLANQATLSSSGYDRTLVMQFDQMGRKIDVSLSITNHTYNPLTGTFAYGASPQTKFEYNAFGDLVTEKIAVDERALSSDVDGWAITRRYYNRGGLLSVVVDPLGYYTKLEYSNFGQLTRQTEYSNPISLDNVSTNSAPAAPVNDNDADLGATRVTEFEYDKLGRRTKSILKNVFVASSYDRDLMQYTTTTKNIVTSTEYDALGNTTVVTDGLGNTTSHSYDAINRVLSIKGPSHQIAGTEYTDPFQKRPSAEAQTEFRRDALGNVVQETLRRVAGLVHFPIMLITSRAMYDHAGNKIQSIDGNQSVTTHRYNARGQKTRDAQNFRVDFSAWKEYDVVQHYFVNRMTDYEYDDLGRNVGTIRGGTLMELNEFNAFGEVTAKRVNGLLQASYRYDNNGRVIHQRTDKGVVEFWYDLAGRNTRRIERGDMNSVSDERVTDSVYDKLGRVLMQRMPKFDVSNAALDSPVLQSNKAPIVRHRYDRWGNLIAYTDARAEFTSLDPDVAPTAQAESYTTRYRYNTFNQLSLQIDPSVTSVNESGVVSTINPTKEFIYDANGRSVVEIDAAGRRRERGFDSVGNEIWQEDSLNYRTDHVYDLRNNRVATRNALGHVNVSHYDNVSNVVRTGILRLAENVYYSSNDDLYLQWLNDPSLAKPVEFTIFRYKYDEAGQRYAVIQGDDEIDGRVAYTSYDWLGNVHKTRSAAGYKREYGYTSRNTKEWEKDGNGYISYWKYDAVDYGFEQLTEHTDIGGHKVAYKYNDFGQLTQETRLQTNLTRTFEYYDNGLLKAITDHEVNDDPLKEGDFEETLESAYYEYDIVGNRVREKQSSQHSYERRIKVDPDSEIEAWRIFNDKQTWTDTRTQYDALNRITTIAAPRNAQFQKGVALPYTVSSLTYSYDEVGNRRNVITQYMLEGSTEEKRKENWYKYDGENRILISQGVFNTTRNEIEIEQDGGVLLHYDAMGRRVSEVKVTSQSTSGTRTTQELYGEQYLYDDLGRFTMIAKRPGLTRTRESDTATWRYNNPTIPTQSLVSAQYDVWGRQVRRGGTTFTYNGDGQLLTQIEMSGNSIISRVQYDFVDSYDGVGNLKKYQMFHSGISQTFNIEYVRFEGYRELKIVGIDSRPDKNVSTTLTYDVKGQLLKKIVDGPEDSTENFTYSRDGQIVRKTKGSKSQQYYYTNSNSVASIGTLTDAEFDYNYTPVSDQYPASAPGSYVVGDGDTLISIARSLFGDGSLWYLIADANSISDAPDTVLTTKVGTTLVVPNVITNIHNNNTTFKPYNPSSIVGDTTPQTYPIEVKPPEPKCGALSSFIGIAVTVIVGIYTGNWGAASAAGNAAQQYSSLMLNGQYDWKRFANYITNPFQGNRRDALRVFYDPLSYGAPDGAINYESIAISYVGGTVGGAVGQGAAAGMNAAGGTAAAWSASVGAAAGAGASYMATYQANRLAGNNPNWSYREFFAASAAALVSSELLGSGQQSQPDGSMGTSAPAQVQQFSWSKLAADTVHNVISSGIRYYANKAFNVDDNHWNGRDTLRDAFGNALANNVVQHWRYEALPPEVRKAMETDPNAGDRYYQRLQQLKERGADSDDAREAATDDAMIGFDESRYKLDANDGPLIADVYGPGTQSDVTLMGGLSGVEFTDAQRDGLAVIEPMVSADFVLPETPELNLPNLDDPDYFKNYMKESMQNYIGSDDHMIDMMGSYTPTNLGVRQMTEQEMRVSGQLDVLREELSQHSIHSVPSVDLLQGKIKHLTPTPTDLLLKEFDGDVKAMQSFLGVKPDGSIGAVTKGAADRLLKGDLLSIDQLVSIFPDARKANLEKFLPALNRYLPEYGVDTPERISAFLGQVGVESGDFSRTSENLNYTTADRLKAVWPKKFSSTTFASGYLKDPEKLANYVYANKNGNGDESTGDGWSYRGSGLIQLTGKDNFARIGNAVGVNLVKMPDLVRDDPNMSVQTALQFWQNKNLNSYADSGRYKALTKSINNALLHYDQRVTVTNRALAVLRK